MTEYAHFRRLRDHQPICSDPHGEKDFLVSDYGNGTPTCITCIDVLNQWKREMDQELKAFKARTARTCDRENRQILVLGLMLIVFILVLGLVTIYG